VYVGEISVYRCFDCKAIVTDIDLRLSGKCPRCNCYRVMGANPTWWECVSLFFRLLLMKGNSDGRRKKDQNNGSDKSISN
jgi:DNA-directed RNA polymerase subunit RPC12/RpoP